jgi:hypothetical protein
MTYVLVVTNCSDSHKWYREHIGKTFPMLDEEPTEYKTRQPEGYINFISKEDCQKIAVNK